MAPGLTRLSSEDLRRLAEALRSHRLGPPYPALAVRRFVPDSQAAEIARDLQTRGEAGLTPSQIADMLDLLVLDREQRAPDRDGVDLVWTGPEAGDVASRDTAVVVRELFRNATESVLVAGYAVYHGHVVFRTLADRMEEAPGSGSACSSTSGGRRETRRASRRSCAASAAISARTTGPGGRLPEVYYDPRSLESDPSRRASLHAKCVVVDEESLFVSSANFTEAAQMRNIEVGVLIRSSVLARQLVEHFESLAGRGTLRPVPLG